MAEIIQIKSRIMIYVDVAVKIKKTSCVWKRSYWKNVKHVGSIIEDSAITSDEITEITKTVPTKTISIKSTSSTSIFIFYSTFY